MVLAIFPARPGVLGHGSDLSVRAAGLFSALARIFYQALTQYLGFRTMATNTR